MRSRRKALLLIALLVLLVNLPLAHSTWTRSRVERSGTDVTASVTDTREVTSDDETGYLVEFRLPADIDPEQTLWTARIDAPTHDQAVETGQLDVRVLPDQPSAYVVEGQVSGRIGLWITLAADLFLLVMGFLLLRSRGRSAPTLELVATEDLVRCKPGSTLERIDALTLRRGGRGARDRRRPRRARPRRPARAGAPRRARQPGRPPAAGACHRPHGGVSGVSGG
ncbi:hypothetical protein [Nocardioides sp.]|uniref:hypothetical protein n=1 Tax=Nocardioides sp. TaxID=35761 RepID=UPI00286A82B9|nr:hypothetical protein [Nocardioides sp.]